MKKLMAFIVIIPVILFMFTSCLQKSNISEMISFDPLAEGQISIRIATYNIANGSQASHNFKKIANDIIDSGAEIIALQEVDQNTSRNKNQNTMKLLSEYTGFEYYIYTPTLSDFDGGQYGIAVLSKYPILSNDYVKLPDGAEPRRVLKTVIDVCGIKFDFFSTHFERGAFAGQIEALKTYVANSETFVVAGDFNNNDFSQFKIISDTNLMINDKNSMSTCKYGRALDNIIISNNIEGKNASVTNTGNSDHYILFCDITLFYDK